MVVGIGVNSTKYYICIIGKKGICDTGVATWYAVTFVGAVFLSQVNRPWTALRFKIGDDWREGVRAIPKLRRDRRQGHLLFQTGKGALCKVELPPLVNLGQSTPTPAGKTKAQGKQGGKGKQQGKVGDEANQQKNKERIDAHQLIFSFLHSLTKPKVSPSNHQSPFFFFCVGCICLVYICATRPRVAGIPLTLILLS